MSSNWYHPYERNEEEQRERRVKFTPDLPATTPSDSLVGAIKKNIESLGGLIPRAGWDRGILKSVDSAPNDSFVLNGTEPATGVPDALQRRAIRGSHSSDASPVKTTAASARVEDQAYQLSLASARAEGDQVYQPFPIRPIASPARKTMAASARVEDQAYQLPLASARAEGDQVYQPFPIRPIGSPARKTMAASARVEDQAYQLSLASARAEGDQVYQPFPIRPIANSPVASAPAYTVELVSVAPGVQIQKKKFLPRYLPMPIGTPPGGLGRPILGRGSLLYSLSPQSHLPSALATQGINRSESLMAEASAQSSSADGNRSISPVGSADYHPLHAPLPKWPFSE